MDLPLLIFGLGLVPLPTLFGVDSLDGLFFFSFFLGTGAFVDTVVRRR